MDFDKIEWIQIREIKQGIIGNYMNYLHYNLQFKANSVVEVILDKQAFVRLFDSANFKKYRSGERNTFYGGLITKSPAKLSPPFPGEWNLVIDLDGAAGDIKASVKILDA